MLELAQRLRLDLPNTLARHVERLPDPLQRLVWFKVYETIESAILRETPDDGGRDDVPRLGELLPDGRRGRGGADRPHLRGHQPDGRPAPRQRSCRIEALHGADRARSELRPGAERRGADPRHLAP